MLETVKGLFSLMGITMSASTVCLTSNIHKIMCAVSFILVNHSIHTCALPGVHGKSSVSKVSGDAGISNLSTSKLY